MSASLDCETLMPQTEASATQMIAFCGRDREDAWLRSARNDRRIWTASLWLGRLPIYRMSAERGRRYEPWLGELRELMPPAAGAR